MKRFIFFFITLLIFDNVYAKDYTWDECIKTAVSTNSMLNNKQLNKNINEAQKYAYSSMNYPQVKLEAQYTFQSDVMELPIKIPTIKIPEISKGQYQIALNVSQSIYDGSYTSSAAKVSDIENKLNDINIDVNSQKIAESINDLYFTCLIYEQNIKVLQNTLDYIGDKRQQLLSLYENGVILKTSLNSLDIEIEKIQNNIFTFQKDEEVIRNIIANYIKDKSFTVSQLSAPHFTSTDFEMTANRPEQIMYNLKSELNEGKKSQIMSQIMPNVSAFAKLGYGDPNPYNIFESGLNSFYMIGVKFQWYFWDWSNNNKSREILEINKQEIANERENFDLTLKNTLLKEESDYLKNKELTNRDDKLIDQQKKIAENSFAQLKGGVITTTEYLLEVNNLTQLELNKELHNLQTIKSLANWIVKANKWN